VKSKEALRKVMKGDPKVIAVVRKCKWGSGSAGVGRLDRATSSHIAGSYKQTVISGMIPKKIHLALFWEMGLKSASSVRMLNVNMFEIEKKPSTQEPSPRTDLIKSDRHVSYESLHHVKCRPRA
jgi:hypothetical protein